MKFSARLAAGMFFAIIALAMWTLIGCSGRQQVGDPGYNDPMADNTPFEETEEYEYLVDLEPTISNFEESIKVFEDSLDLPDSDMSLGDESIVDSLGLTKDSIMSEANESMVHAVSEYTIAPDGVEAPLEWFADAGTSEIRIPARFNPTVYVGHLFIANPGSLIENIIEEVERATQESMNEMGLGGEMEMDSDQMAMMMLGVESMDEVYGWIGDEMIMFNLINNDFDAGSEVTYDNMPIHQIMAVSSDTPEAGLDLVENFMGSFMMMMVGMTSERTEYDKYDALIIPPMDVDSNEMMREMMTEEDLEMYRNMPDTILVAMDGYLFMADENSMESLMDLYELDDEGASTGRTASFEFEQNWDITVDSWRDGDPFEYMTSMQQFDMEDLPTLQNIILRIYSEVQEINELGLSRISITVIDDDSFEMDLLTSKESIRLYEAVMDTLNDITDEEWETLGEEFGAAIAPEMDMPTGSPGGFPGMGS